MATIPYRSQTLYYRTRLDIDSVLQRFRDVRRFSEFLCEPLKTEDYVVQSMPDASPTRWHLAHTNWLFGSRTLLGSVHGSESRGWREKKPLCQKILTNLRQRWRRQRQN